MKIYQVKSITHSAELALLEKGEHSSPTVAPRFKITKYDIQLISQQPFMCSICGLTFSYKDVNGLIYHVENKHKFSKTVRTVKEEKTTASFSEGKDESSEEVNIDSTNGEAKMVANDASEDTISEAHISDFEDEDDDVRNRSELSTQTEESVSCETQEGRNQGKTMTAASAVNVPQNSGTIEEKAVSFIKNADTVSKSKCYFCSVCFFGSEKLLLEHLQTYHPKEKLICNICNASFSVDRYKDFCEHNNTPHSRNGEKKIQEEDTVKPEKRLKPKKGICEFCGRTFQLGGPMNMHKRGHHPKEFKSLLTSVCHICGEFFTTATSVEKHIQRVHTSVMPYTCETCGKNFKSKQDLKIHFRNHTGEKPYTCSFCGLKLKTHARKALHERAHTHDRPYHCSECNQSFTSRGGLLNHRITHSDVRSFRCDECGKMFKTASTLRVHKNLHLGIKKFECSVCGQRFSGKGNLVHHVRIHTGEKPFKCSECDSAFSRHNWMKTHMAKQHGIHLGDGRKRNGNNLVAKVPASNVLTVIDKD